MALKDVNQIVETAFWTLGTILLAARVIAQETATLLNTVGYHKNRVMAKFRKRKTKEAR